MLQETQEKVTKQTYCDSLSLACGSWFRIFDFDYRDVRYKWHGEQNLFRKAVQSALGQFKYSAWL